MAEVYKVFATGLVALALTASAASAAQTLVAQGPCGSDPCVTFSTTGDIPAVRQISATAPFAGLALVSFHGAMHCDTQGVKVDNFAEFQTQILSLNDLTPVGAESGGLELLSTLSSSGDHTSFGSMSYNLASQRVYNVTQGQTLNIAFRIARLRMGGNVVCTIGKSAAFTVQFAQ